MNPDAPNVLQAMMKLEQANARAKNANKVALEAEKEKDAAVKAVEELKRQLQPKRTRTDDDAGDAHDHIYSSMYYYICVLTPLYMCPHLLNHAQSALVACSLRPHQQLKKFKKTHGDLPRRGRVGVARATRRMHAA